MFLRNLVRPTQIGARNFSGSALRASVARMTLIGRVGADPEKLESKKGNFYVKYPLAVNTSKEHTSWFQILIFDENLIEFMEKYISKGTLVYVEADASMNKYTTEDEQTRSSLSLIQQSITPILWPKRDATKTEEGA